MAMVRDVTDAPVEAASSPSDRPSDRLTTREAARLIGVTEERIRTLASDGRAPAEMVSHKWWFSRRELERMMAECPAVLYARRTPAVAQVTQARRERSRANMLRLNATQDRHEAARRGYLGLLAKIAREMDPQNILPADERERRVQLAYRAQMADARAKRQATNHNPMSESERMTLIETKARRQQLQQQQLAQAEKQTPLSICYQCWREEFGGRPPSKLVNVLCERHQRENDEFAASLRGAAS